MSNHTSNKSLITQILSATVMSISLMAFGTAHAEQYCKSLDKDGSATYTLASDKGCKKMKTVAINHHITPSAPAAPKTEAAKTNSTETAATTAPTATGSSTAPATTAAPAAATSMGAAANTTTSKPQQTPNR